MYEIIVIHADKDIADCADLCNANSACLAFMYGAGAGFGQTQYKARDCLLSRKAIADDGCSGDWHNIDFYKKEAKEAGFCEREGKDSAKQCRRAARTKPCVWQNRKCVEETCPANKKKCRKSSACDWIGNKCVEKATSGTDTGSTEEKPTETGTTEQKPTDTGTTEQKPTETGTTDGSEGSSCPTQKKACKKAVTCRWKGGECIAK